MFHFSTISDHSHTVSVGRAILQNTEATTMIIHGWHYHLDPQVDPKIAKRHFFQDIQNSFQWPTGIGLEPHQKIFQKKKFNKYRR